MFGADPDSVAIGGSAGRAALGAGHLDIGDGGAVGVALDVRDRTDPEAVGAHAHPGDHAAYRHLPASRRQTTDDVVDLVLLAVDAHMARAVALRTLSDAEHLRRPSVERYQLADLKAHVTRCQDSSERPVVVVHDSPPMASRSSPIPPPPPFSVYRGV
jgi:hypothetical protein